MTAAIVETATPPVVIRPVSGLVKWLGLALVAAVLLLTYTVVKANADRATSDAVRGCLSQTAADVDQIGALATAATNASTAAGFKLVFLNSDLREHPLSGPDDPRIAEARELQYVVTSQADAATRYTPRWVALLDLRTKAPGECTRNPDYRLPPDLLRQTP